MMGYRFESNSILIKIDEFFCVQHADFLDFLFFSIFDSCWEKCLVLFSGLIF